MARLLRHRQTKGSETDRPNLNHRATPRLYRFPLIPRSRRGGGKVGIPRSLRDFQARWKSQFLDFSTAARSGGGTHADHQGNFVADIEPIKNKRTRQTTLIRIRLIQLRPVELLISDSIATDAHAARERAESKLREALACERVLSKAA